MVDVRRADDLQELEEMRTDDADEHIGSNGHAARGSVGKTCESAPIQRPEYRKILMPVASVCPIAHMGQDGDPMFLHMMTSTND